LKLQKIDISSCLDEWNSYLLSNTGTNNHSIAHNPSIVGCIETAFNCKSEYYYLIENAKIVGLLPGFRVERKFISVPIFPTAGIFTHNLSKLEEWYSQIVKILPDYEIRSNLKFGKYVYDKKINCYLKLQDSIDNQFNDFSSKLRSDIRKGYKNGITANQGGEELIDEFYSIYSQNMHHLGSPVLSKKFFQELTSKYKNGIARIFIAKTDDKELVGCGLLLTYGKLAELGWASTISEYNKFKTNMVLYWEVIRFCIENSFDVFSFGRATKGSGSHNFKRQWGVTEVPIYFNYSNYKFDIRRLRFLGFLWRKLPSDIAYKIGPLLRRLTKI